MADEIVITHDDDTAESAPAVIPVIVPDNSASVELAYQTGANDARLAELERENAELRSRLDAVEVTDSVATDMAVNAAVTAEIAAEIATEAASDPEPVAEETVETEPDARPNRQHWMFREKDEWGRK